MVLGLHGVADVQSTWYRITFLSNTVTMFVVRLSIHSYCSLLLQDVILFNVMIIDGLSSRCTCYDHVLRTSKNLVDKTKKKIVLRLYQQNIRIEQEII